MRIADAEGRKGGKEERKKGRKLDGASSALQCSALHRTASHRIALPGEGFAPVWLHFSLVISLSF